MLRCRALAFAAALTLLAALASASAASYDAGPLTRALNAKIAFDIADEYREENFNRGARTRPCTTQPDWDGRYLCSIFFPATADEPERAYPIWVYKQRGHACIFDPADEPGYGQCVPPRDRPGVPRTVAEFRIAATNGYELEAERFDRTLTLTVSRRGATAEYVLAADGSPGNDRIAASIPGLIEIDVEFRPTSRTTSFPPGCWYHVTRHTRGFFVGTIRFEGEGGYAGVDASRARGTYNHRVLTGCDPKERSRASASSRSQAGETIELGSEISTTDTRVDFGAAKGPYPLFAPLDLELGKRRFFHAETFENGKAVDITRKVESIGPPSSFTVNSAVTRATVSPPPPFSGTASLIQENPASFSGTEPTWIGDLRVTLPGAPNTPLVGPGFEVHLHKSS